MVVVVVVVVLLSSSEPFDFSLHPANDAAIITIERIMQKILQTFSLFITFLYRVFSR